MYKQILIKMYECSCERCNHKWLSENIPKSCAKCKTRSWNVKKKNAI